MKYLVALILAVMIGGGGFYYGKQSERTHWAAEVKRVQEEVIKQKEKADEHTKAIEQSYAKKLADLRIRNGSPRNDLGPVVRVQSSCPSGDPATGQTGETTRDSLPVVTQTEWERINHERFEENRIQLEALIEWVNSLYRDYSTR